MVYHSIFWQYLAARAQDAAPAPSRRRRRGATPEAPLAWLRMEGDGADPGAAITLTLWPGGETRLLGRADFHGAWVRWSRLDLSPRVRPAAPSPYITASPSAKPPAVAPPTGAPPLSRTR